MIFYFPYIFLVFFVTGLLILVCCHKPMSRKVKIILLGILLVIIIMCFLILSMCIFPFSTPDDVISYYKDNSSEMIVYGKNTAVAILDLPNSDFSLKGFNSDKSGWHPINCMQNIYYRNVSLTTPTGTICLIELPEDDGIYILNIWTDLISGQIETLSDSIDSVFSKCSLGTYSASLIYVPELTNDYVLYINEQPVDLNSLKDQLGEKDTSKLGEILLFSLAAMAFFAIIGGIIAYSVWLRKRRQPRGLRR